MRLSVMKSSLKLLLFFLFTLLIGCDRSTEEVQSVSEQQDVSEAQNLTEAQETLEIQEAAAEAQTEPEPGLESEQVPKPSFALADIPVLNPLPWISDPFPESGRPELVHFATDAGDIFIAVYPDAAPNAAERFLHLVDIGYYDDTPVSRVVPGFVAQFGINWRSEYKHWRDEKFDDDPTLFAFEPGTIAFAKAGPNTNSTQVFINYTNNNRLADPQYNFAVFGQVFEGMDVVRNFVSVGDRSGGLNQTELWENGDQYMDSLPDLPNMILKASRIR